MPKLSEADVLDSIFTIIVGTIVSQGRVDKSDINAARAIIEPSLFSSGSYEGSLTKDAKREKGSNPADIFNVSVSIKIPPKRNEKNKILYSSSSEIGNLNDKINELIALASPFKMPQISKILKARNQYLDNTKEEGITFLLSSDGGYGDDVAYGNVDVSMRAQVANEEPEDVIQETVTFSLKTTEEDPKNTESYDNMISLANAFELKWKNVSDYNDVKKKATTGSEKQKRSQILREMCDDLLRQISQNKVDASRRIYEFLRLAESLVEVSQSARKTMEDLDELQKSVVLSASASGRSVKFRDTKKGKVYFTLKADQKFDKIEFRLE